MVVRSAVAAGMVLLLASCTGSRGEAGEDAAARNDVAAGTGGSETAGNAPAAAVPPAAAPVGGTGNGGAAAPAPRPAHPCQSQDDKPIPAMHLRALGTEPFWAARVEGRCVTYMTPEDQDGTRVWARFSGSAERGEWSGHLDNQAFVLRTRPEPGCSDGMSDNRYPLAVSLTVRGEQRTGCAEPV